MGYIKKVVIVGGGTAGLTTALILKSIHSELDIQLIKSSKEQIVGVGEGSTPEWHEFLQITDINFKELIKEAGATTKIGILFNDWNYKNHQYTHSVLYDFPNKILDYLILTNSNKPFPLSQYFSSIYFQNKVPIITPQFEAVKSYHFDTFKLNDFLIKKCKEKGITIKDYFVQNLNLNNKGEILSLQTLDNKTIEGDFFIDCTGFKRVLISKLGAKWKSYRDNLPVSHAITFPTPLDPKKGIETYTTATALSSGWAWKIPTQFRYGNGYVFDSRYINEDNALNEINKHLNINVEKVAKSIPFEAGKLNNLWIKNCVAIGLSGSFLEPLEAQSIGYGIRQATILANELYSYPFSKSVINNYNSRLDRIFNNVLNMVQIHYLTKRNDSKFWKEKPFNLTSFNKEKLELFSYGFIDYSHFDAAPHDLLFSPTNFYHVLQGMDIISLEKIQHKIKLLSLPISELKKEYEDFIENHLHELERYSLFNPDIISIDHMEYLNLLKQH